MYLKLYCYCKMYATRSQTKLAQTQKIDNTSVNRNREFELNKREKEIKEKEEQYKRDLEEIDRHYHEIYAKLLDLQKKEEALMDREMKLKNQEDDLARAKETFRLEKEALGLKGLTNQRYEVTATYTNPEKHAIPVSYPFQIGNFDTYKKAHGAMLRWMRNIGGIDEYNFTIKNTGYFTVRKHNA